MSDYETLDLSVDDDGVATLRLSRPERHNAMDAAMITELDAAAGRLAEDDGVRAVVLTGAGESFCAGGDLGWMRAQFDATREERVAEATRLSRMLARLDALPKPLVGRINGQAYGGGLGLISVCDAAIATREARFAFTETRLGLIPATISPFVVARIGSPAARRLFMSARRFDPDDAVGMGLLTDCVAAGDLDRAVGEEVATYLACVAPAVARAKELARRLGPDLSEATLARTAELLADCWETEEARTGIAAFLDKRGARG